MGNQPKERPGEQSNQGINRRDFLKLSAAAGTSWGLSGTESLRPHNPETGFREIPFTVLERGQNCGIDIPQTLVARTEAQLDDVLERLSRPRSQELERRVRDGNIILFHTLGMRNSAGFSVVTESVRREPIGKNGKVVIKKAEYQPSKNSYTAQVITTPFEIISIPLKGLENAAFECGSDIILTEVLRTYQSRCKKAIGTAIKSREELDKFLEESLENSTAESRLLLSTYDPKYEELAAVSPGEQNSGGIWQEAMKIKRISDSSGGKLSKLEAEVKLHKPGPDQVATSSLTFPLTIYKFSATDALRQVPLDFVNA